MAGDLKVWGPDGVLQFSGSDRLGRILGNFTIVGNSSDRAFTDSNMLNGSPFAVFFPDGTGSPYVSCLVQASGQTITWQFKGQNANQIHQNPNGTVLYGIY